MRLFSELPLDSRSIKEISPVESWTWQDEVNSHMLQVLRVIEAHYYNSHRPKGAKKQKVQEFLQPDYVKETKELIAELRASEKAENIDDDTRDFWEKRTGVSMK